MLQITVKRKSPLIGKAQKLDDIGAIVVNDELIVISANQRAHDILSYPSNYIYGKPLVKIIRNEIYNLEHLDEELLGLLKLDNKVVARQLSDNDRHFVTTTDANGKSITLAMFYVNDPISRVIGCYFIEYKNSHEVDHLIQTILKLERLKNKLKRVVKERDLNHQLKETYRKLVSNWKQIVIGIGSVLLLTTGVLSLFVSGFIGNRFGKKPSEYYQRLEERINRKVNRKVNKKVEQELEESEQRDD